MSYHGSGVSIFLEESIQKATIRTAVRSVWREHCVRSDTFTYNHSEMDVTKTFLFVCLCTSLTEFVTLLLNYVLNTMDVQRLKCDGCKSSQMVSSKGKVADSDFFEFIASPIFCLPFN